MSSLNVSATSRSALSYFAAHKRSFVAADGTADPTKTVLKFPLPRVVTTPTGKTRKSVNMLVRFAKASGLKGTKRITGKHNLVLIVPTEKLASAKVALPFEAFEAANLDPNFKPSNATRRR